MNIFRYDSPLMQLLTRAADLIWLNILVLICSIPVFTFGASLSAMETVIYKILHNEDVLVTKEFFKAFGRNFKQATVIWLIILVIESALAYNFYYSRQIGTSVSEAMKTAAAVLFVLVYAFMLYIFPLQAHYINKTKDIFKNAGILLIVHPIRSIIMLAVQALFIGLGVLIFFDYRFIPLLVAFGISFPWYVCACLHMPVFDKLDGIDRNGNKIAPDNYRKEESGSGEDPEEPDLDVTDEDIADDADEDDGEEEKKSGS